MLARVRVVKLAVLGRAVKYPLLVTQDWVDTALLAIVRVVKLAVLGSAVRYPLLVTQDWVATALLARVRVVKLAVLGRAVKYLLTLEIREEAMAGVICEPVAALPHQIPPGSNTYTGV